METPRDVYRDSSPGRCVVTAGPLERGRLSFARQSWGDAFAQLTSADEVSSLEVDDLERLAVAAYLVGKDNDSADVWTRAHQEHLRQNETARAARCAFWVAFGLMGAGELARCHGWLARGRRLLDDDELDCVEQGYLLYLVAKLAIFQGDLATSRDTFAQASAIAERFGDLDLVTLARHGEGRALIGLGKVIEGVALLDEVMVAVTSGEVSPAVTGDVYCSVIEACQEIFDLRRAHAWTAALARWCESQAGMVPYRGQCLVHRAEIMQLHGAWPDALGEARRAGEWLARPPGHPATGAALYVQAELHRLRGALRPCRAAPAARRVRGSRAGIPCRESMGTRAATRAGTASARTGPGRARTSGSPPPTGRRAGSRHQVRPLSRAHRDRLGGRRYRRGPSRCR
jgi:hypothetical protein